MLAVLKFHPVRRLDVMLRLLRSHFPYLRERFGVGTLSVFGSYTRGEGDGSDLDLLIEFEEGAKTYDNLVQLRVEGILHVKVDVLTPEMVSNNPFLRENLEEDLLRVA